MTKVNNVKMQKLNAILDEWTAQFDNKPDPFLKFEVTENNMLSANGVILAPMELIVADEAAWDVEFLEIPLATGVILEIAIQWGFDEPRPSIGYISRTEILYRSPEKESSQK